MGNIYIESKHIKSSRDQKRIHDSVKKRKHVLDFRVYLLTECAKILMLLWLLLLSFAPVNALSNEKAPSNNFPVFKADINGLKLDLPVKSLTQAVLIISGEIMLFRPQVDHADSLVRREIQKLDVSGSRILTLSYVINPIDMCQYSRKIQICSFFEGYNSIVPPGIAFAAQGYGDSIYNHVQKIEVSKKCRDHKIEFVRFLVPKEIERPSDLGTLHDFVLLIDSSVFATLQIGSKSMSRSLASNLRDGFSEFVCDLIS